MPRLRCLQDFSAAGVDAMIECKGCGRRVRIDTHKLMRKISNVQWWQWLDAQGQRLRCDECKHRGARIAPVPKIVGPLDCPEFQADIDALWERTMANAEEEALLSWTPQVSDGHLWIHDGDTSLNLGPVVQALGKLVPVMAEYDLEEHYGLAAPGGTLPSASGTAESG